MTSGWDAGRFVQALGCWKKISGCPLMWVSGYFGHVGWCGSQLADEKVKPTGLRRWTALGVDMGMSEGWISLRDSRSARAVSITLTAIAGRISVWMRFMT